MSLKHLLEEFPSDANRARGTAGAEAAEAARLETARADGFELVYTSGWDDAIKSEREKRAAIDAELARSVQDLGLTIHDATDQVRAELVTFLDEMIAALFPEIVPDLLRETVRAEALALAEGHLNPSIKLMASESVAAQIEDMMPETGFDIELETEDSLGPHQAFLTLAGQERLVDFTPLIETIRQQLAAMTEPNTPEMPDE
ncbi:MAG: hypothetical protein AAF368_11765 [Planctomycetota bacterium]